MTYWIWWHFMNFLGYRRVLYQPSNKGLSMADFYAWEYAPSLEKRDYTERDFPFYMFWGK
jgi:hypothetical protein